MRVAGPVELCLGSPEPAQDIDSENCNTGAGRDSGEALLCAWLTMREGVPADDDCNQGCGLRYGSSEEGLYLGDAAIEGGCVRCEWADDEQRGDGEETCKGLSAGCGAA